MSDVIDRNLVTVPSSATSIHADQPVVLNPHNEDFIDVILGTDTAVTLVGWLQPGKEVGDELTVRVLRRPASVSGGVDSSNQATFHMQVMTPDSLTMDANYPGFGATTFFSFPAYSTNYAFTGPASALFRWDGSSWLAISTRLPS